ncbi:MAG TPA: dihydroorotate dehydrogenase [Synergistales bacterium]|jgi:dihydroorotate dehydrogenase (NAD+) catalytic subunit|nr:dihydroorotate dehydrogenase [Synergistales bacterium]HRV70592.1 dihydroorotate dehydrogenase [Thermovirgaceae bacterium]
MGNKRLETVVGGVRMETPVIIASGVWPMDPGLWPTGSMDGVGAVCSKGITLYPRKGNTGGRVFETPSGMLNSIGLQNPGVSAFIDEDLGPLSSAGFPVIVNVAFGSIEELDDTVHILEKSVDKIGAIELNVSCPNVSSGGMSWGTLPSSLEEAVAGARAAWNGPLWVKLTPQAWSIADASKVCENAGADAVVVGNTWLGMAVDNQNEKPFFDRIFAGLSGPAIFPLSLRMVWEAAGSVAIPVIGCGGVSGPDEALSMMLAGASAIQAGTSLFVESRLPSLICRGLIEHMDSHSLENAVALTGRARPEKGAATQKC